MEVEERGGADPARLAAAIHLQLGASQSPVPIREIAYALDIVEITESPLSNIEGALVTTSERDSGVSVHIVDPSKFLAKPLNHRQATASS